MIYVTAQWGDIGPHQFGFPDIESAGVFTVAILEAGGQAWMPKADYRKWIGEPEMKEAIDARPSTVYPWESDYVWRSKRAFAEYRRKVREASLLASDLNWLRKRNDEADKWSEEHIAELERQKEECLGATFEREDWKQAFKNYMDLIDQASFLASDLNWLRRKIVEADKWAEERIAELESPQ